MGAVLGDCAPVAGGLEVGLLRAGDELLQGPQLVGLCVRKDELAVHLAVLDLLAHHQQELDQLIVRVRLGRLGDDLRVPADVHRASDCPQAARLSCGCGKTCRRLAMTPGRMTSYLEESFARK